MSLSHALLAALSHEPASGYDLAHHFDSSLGHFWPASHQQIYRDLARLEAQGCVAFQHKVQSGKPGRKVYHLTELGLAELQRWIAEPGNPPPIRDSLLVKLYGGQTVSPALLLTEVAQQRQRHQERLQLYLEIESRYFAGPATLPYPQKLIWLTLQAGLMYERQRLAWCELALTELHAMEGFPSGPRLIN